MVKNTMFFTGLSLFTGLPKSLPKRIKNLVEISLQMLYNVKNRLCTYET